MPTWVIQKFEALDMCCRWYLANNDEQLFFDRFSNENCFAAALHEDEIAGVVQDNNEQDNDNVYGDRNINEDLDNLPGIYIDPTAACGEISGVPPPENLVEIP